MTSAFEAAVIKVKSSIMQSLENPPSLSSGGTEAAGEQSQRSGVISAELSGEPYSVSTGIPKFFDFENEQERVQSMQGIIETTNTAMGPPEEQV